MNYKEITLPGGTFRMYDDQPNVWIQQLQRGEKNVSEKIMDAYNAGDVSKKNVWCPILSMMLLRMKLSFLRP